MKANALSIVIPAYNEEQSIAEIIKRCLEARTSLMNQTGLVSIEVIVVNDGSRDKTEAIAQKSPGIKLISHPVNRGYGAALMTGFQAASNEYLAFLDADGTCDPQAFADLFKALEKNHADMVVGNRLHGESRMPKLRELGNRFYAQVISGLSGVKVADCASGMRVFKQSWLERLAPLPTGLHFTPAMTARAACLGANIVEIPIPYAQRQGHSKLNVIADGLRFLQIILGIIFAYYPLRIFAPLGLFFLAIALLYGLGPVRYYGAHHHLEEDMIYRLLTIVTLAVCGVIAMSYGSIAQRISNLVTGRRTALLEASWLRSSSLILGILLGLTGILLNSKTILEYVSSGRISIHWVYVLVGGLSVILGTVLFCFGVTLGLISHLPSLSKEK